MSTSHGISRFRRRQAVRPAALALLFLLVAACAAQEEVARTSAAIGDDFELVSDDPAVAGREPAPAAAEEVVLADDFDSLDPRWSVPGAASGAAETPPRVELVAEAAGAHGIALVAPGLGGLRTRIDVARTDALLVTARVRSFSSARAAVLRASNVTGDRHEPRPVACSVTASAGFTEWHLVIEPCRARKSVQIDLVPGDRPLAIDRVEVRCLRPVEALWLAPPVEHAPPLPRARHHVELATMDLALDGYYVPAGATLRWRARVPKSSPRLDLETCLVGGDRAGGVEWSILVDGRPLARRKEKLPAAERTTPFAPWLVPLDAYAGRDVVIELRCGGDRSVVGFAGAPQVVGGAAPAAKGAELVSLRDR